MHWKAVKNGPNKSIELYNLTEDAGERYDIAGSHPETVAEAASIMKTAHVDDPNWPIFENQKQRNEWRKEKANARQ